MPGSSLYYISYLAAIASIKKIDFIFVSKE